MRTRYSTVGRKQCISADHDISIRCDNVCVLTQIRKYSANERLSTTAPILMTCLFDH